MKTLGKLFFMTLLSSLFLFSCELEEDNPQPIDNDIIPIGMENKLVFEGIYDDMTTSFTHGILEIFDTTCALDLYFIHNATGDTLNFYMNTLPYNNGLPEGTYTIDPNGTFDFAMAGDWTHSEFFAESGELIIERDGNLYKAVFDFEGISHGSGNVNDATAIGYFKGELIDAYN